MERVQSQTRDLTIEDLVDQLGWESVHCVSKGA